MARFSFPTQDVLFATNGRAPLAIIGGISLSIGLLMLYGAYALVVSDGQIAGKVVGVTATTLFGSIFVVGGFLLLNGPDQVTIDRQAKTVVQQYGSTIALRRHEYSLKDFSSVYIFRPRLKGDTSSVPSYRVMLFRDNENHLIVQSVRKLEEAQDLARQLSIFLNFPLSSEVVSESRKSKAS